MNAIKYSIIFINCIHKIFEKINYYLIKNYSEKSIYYYLMQILLVYISKFYI